MKNLKNLPNHIGIGVLVAASFHSFPSAGKENRTANQPNILLFLVDDMGWQDTSVPFWKEKTALNKKFQTPNMERLAAQGMKFTQAYACSVC